MMAIPLHAFFLALLWFASKCSILTTADSFSNYTQMSYVTPLGSQISADDALRQALAGKVAEDQAALRNVFDFAKYRLESFKRANSSVPHLSSFRQAIGGTTINTNKTCNTLFNRVSTSMQNTRLDTLSIVSPEDLYYKPVWSQSNAHNISLNCAVTRCLLVLEPYRTGRTKVFLEIDAVGRNAGLPQDAPLIHGQDARKVQFILKRLEHINSLVDMYNVEAEQLAKNNANSCYVPKLKFFIEIIRYMVEVVHPVWPWEYNLRAFVQLSMVDTIPQLGYSLPTVAFVGDSALKERQELFSWKRREDEQGIGTKKVYSLRASWDFRSPYNVKYTDSHALLVECFYRTHTLAQELESQSILDDLPMWRYLLVSQPLLKDEPWNGSNSTNRLNLEMSLVWNLNFPVAAQAGAPVS